LNIAAGIRWLFRKREIAQSKLARGRRATWRDAVAEYKDYDDPNDPQMLKLKEPDWKNCTEKELWEYVASHLSKNGIDTILVGGAVVAIYTEGLYRSGDLDLVQLNYLNKNLPKAMK
jgi:ABC-type transport system substrate-binding protein